MRGEPFVGLRAMRPGPPSYRATRRASTERSQPRASSAVTSFRNESSHRQCSRRHASSSATACLHARSAQQSAEERMAFADALGYGAPLGGEPHVVGHHVHELLALQLGQRLRHARLRHAQPAGYVHGADVAVLALQRQHGFQIVFGRLMNRLLHLHLLSARAAAARAVRFPSLRYSRNGPPVPLQTAARLLRSDISQAARDGARPTPPGASRRLRVAGSRSRGRAPARP